MQILQSILGVDIEETASREDSLEMYIERQRETSDVGEMNPEISCEHEHCQIRFLFTDPA